MTSQSTSNNMTTAMETLVGTKLLTKVGTPLKETKKIMEGKDLALLYFSASWCPVSIILFYCLLLCWGRLLPLCHVTSRHKR